MKIKSWIAFIPLFFAAVSCSLAVSPTAAPALPVPSTVQPAFTLTAPGETAAPAVGAIAGHLSYPSEAIPELRVAAFEAADPGQYYFVDTVPNQNTYRIDGVPAGTYHVVAYVLDPAYDIAGGYSRAVPCGLQSSCDDHSLLEVVVRAGQVTENINPGDWYAPKGAFPPQPGP